nr:hypothetical protein [Tanacetum cinerariifolium]
MVSPLWLIEDSACRASLLSYAKLYILTISDSGGALVHCVVCLPDEFRQAKCRHPDIHVDPTGIFQVDSRMEDDENPASHFLHSFLSPIRVNLVNLIRNLNSTPCEQGVSGHPSGRHKCHIHPRPGGSTILDVSSIGEYLVYMHVVCLAVDAPEAVVRLEIAANTHGNDGQAESHL